MGGDGAEDVSAMERRGWLRAPEFSASQFDSLPQPAQAPHGWEQQAVIGADERVAAARFEGNRTARRTDAGIDHRNVDRARWERLDGGPQQECAGADVLRRHRVRQVYDGDRGRNRKDGGFDLAHVRVGEAEVGQ